MAEIRLEALGHSYAKHPAHASDWAVRQIDLIWQDGATYALLGPSGCGKTTMLNLISGLLYPTHGRILFNGNDVTMLDTAKRNIAQVFQFPVVYDTMTVYENLAFPIKNRKWSADKIKTKVLELAKITGLTDSLHKKARGLAQDEKQKISLARSLIREDVNAILFDEPLTVIDPQLKWELRYNLKKLHQEFNYTMIYVTHDQTEALTFADHIVVMFEGQVVQIGSPKELFEKPQHTFVGSFIGSPGMNILPCTFDSGILLFSGGTYPMDIPITDASRRAGSFELGIRPEFIRFTDSNSKGYEARVLEINDIGATVIVKIRLGETLLKAVLPVGQRIPEPGSAKITFDPDHVHVYQNGWNIRSITS